MGIYSSVLASLAELDPLDPRDEAVAELALSYARAMEDGTLARDSAFGIDTMGPKLLACLVQLQLTPAARATALKGGGGQAPPAAPADPLDELRARRNRDLG